MKSPVNILNYLTDIFRKWRHRTSAAPNRQDDVQGLVLEIAQAQEMLEQAQLDLTRTIQEKTNTERWLVSTRKQLGIRNRQIKQALQQGEAQIARELAEDMVDLQVLIIQEDRILNQQTDRINVLQQNIEEGMQAIETLKASHATCTLLQTYTHFELVTVDTATVCNATDIRESFNLLKRVHLALKTDLHAAQAEIENPKVSTTTYSQRTRQTKTKHINAIIQKAKADLEMED